MSDLQIACCHCKTPFTVPSALATSARASEDIFFYCPYGHSQHFPKGDTEADILRRERDRLKQHQAMLEEDLKSARERRRDAERSVIAMKGQVTKLKKRASAGVCPCCTRSFEDLRRHMSTKHPQFLAEDTSNVVTLKTG